MQCLDLPPLDTLPSFTTLKPYVPPSPGPIGLRSAKEKRRDHSRKIAHFQYKFYNGNDKKNDGIHHRFNVRVKLREKLEYQQELFY